MSATAARSAAGSRATSTTRAPAAASAWPSARPSPRLPPVTRAAVPVQFHVVASDGQSGAGPDIPSAGLPICWQDAILLPCQQDAARNLGRNISELREARGLSQQQIARLADIPRATWANLESGAANPTLAVLVKVAQALQVRLEELIEPPRRSGRLYPVAALPVRKRGRRHRAQAAARDHRRPGDRAHGAAARRGDERHPAHARAPAST